MKIISIHKETEDLIEEALKGNRNIYKQLYQTYSPGILSLCRQYMGDFHRAEDMMVQVFVKAFDHLNSYRREGSFKAWLRRIAVNECISHLRCNNLLIFDDRPMDLESEPITADSHLHLEDIQALIDDLPEGCRTVFNLYAIEGYKHHEISEMLGISPGTSKSQLAYARRLLQTKIKQLNTEYHGKISI